jgi:hypothetical protein
MPWIASSEIAQLRDLAGRKGLEVMRATLTMLPPRPSRWLQVVGKGGSKAFSAKELRSLLNRLPDRTG